MDIRMLVALLVVLTPAQAIELEYAWDMQPTDDMWLIEQLNIVLGTHEYNRSYAPGVFDCIDTVQITSRVLEENGFRPMVLMRAALKSSDDESHLWLAVPDGLGEFAFIETTLFAQDPSAGLGGVVIPEDVESMGYDHGYIVDDMRGLLACFGLENRTLDKPGIESLVKNRC